MKKITTEQIKQVLETVYTTNVPASTFDSLKQFFMKLPDIEAKTEDKKE